MLSGLILAGVLVLLAVLLGREPKTATTVPTRLRPGPAEPEPPRPPSPLRWVASDRESGWHIPLADGPLATTLCGHRLRGALRSRLGPRAPREGGRVTCPACCHAADLPIETAPHPSTGPAFADLVTLRAVESRGGRHRMEDPIVWPTRDPDEEDPGSHYLPGSTTEPTTPGRHALAA